MSGLPFHPWTITLRTEQHVPLDAVSVALYIATAIIVGVLTYRRPALGIAALVLVAPFSLARYIGPTTITLLKAGLLGLFVALALRRPGVRAFGTAPVYAVLATFGVLELAIGLSAIHAQYHAPVLREALKVAEYAALFTGAVIAYAGDPDDRPFWRALETVVVLVCGSALVQYVSGASSGIFIGHHGVPRIAGALEGPNQLAGWLEIAIPVVFARNLLHRDGVLVAILIVAAITEVLTFSRAGIVATMFACALVLVVMRTPRAVGMRFAIATIVMTAVVGLAAVRAGLPPRYFSLDQVPQQADHLGNRAELWHAAIALWQSSPLVGVGAGNYEFVLARVGLFGVRTHANSIYLQSLAEGGIVMLGATLASFITVLVMLARSAVRRPIVVGMLAATAAVALHQIFDDLFFFPKVGSMYWLTLGVAVAEMSAQALFERRRARAFAPVVA